MGRPPEGEPKRITTVNLGVLDYDKLEVLKLKFKCVNNSDLLRVLINKAFNESLDSNTAARDVPQNSTLSTKFNEYMEKYIAHDMRTGIKDAEKHKKTMESWIKLTTITKELFPEKSEEYIYNHMEKERVYYGRR